MCFIRTVGVFLRDILQHTERYTSLTVLYCRVLYARTAAAFYRHCLRLCQTHCLTSARDVPAERRASSRSVSSCGVSAIVGSYVPDYRAIRNIVSRTMSVSRGIRFCTTCRLHAILYFPMSNLCNCPVLRCGLNCSVCSCLKKTLRFQNTQILPTKPCM